MPHAVALCFIVTHRRFFFFLQIVGKPLGQQLEYNSLYCGALDQTLHTSAICLCSHHAVHYIRMTYVITGNVCLLMPSATAGSLDLFSVFMSYFTPSYHRTRPHPPHPDCGQSFWTSDSSFFPKWRGGGGCLSRSAVCEMAWGAVPSRN